MYKLSHIGYLATLLALALFVGCERGAESLATPSGEASLVASYKGDGEVTRVVNNQWESSDFIGVTTSDSEEFNMCYMVDANGAMNNTEDDYKISVVGSKSYYAYYPYDNSIESNGLKTIDLTQQSTLSGDMFEHLNLMWCKQEDVSAYQPMVYLLFRRQLVHLDVMLCLRECGYDSSRGVTLSGAPMRGTFDIRSGELVSEGDAASCGVKVQSVDSYTLTDHNGVDSDLMIVRCEGMVLPMESGEVTFAYYDTDGVKYKYTTSVEGWEAGNSYTYNITNQGYESFYLKDFEGDVTPYGNLWIIADEGIATEADFAALRERLKGTGVVELEHTLLFPNLKVLPSGALRDCLSLYSITMPKVETIGSEALKWCRNIRSVDAAAVEYISASAFEGCADLATIEGMTELYILGESALEGCTSLSEVVLPKLSNMGDNAFEGCSALVNFAAPYLDWVGKGAFAGCGAIEEIIVGVNLQNRGLSNLESGWVDHSRAAAIDLVAPSILPNGVSQSGTTLTYATGESDTFKTINNQIWQLSDITSSNMPQGDVWVVMDQQADTKEQYDGLLAALATRGAEVELLFPYLESLPEDALLGAVNISSIDLPSVTSIGAGSLTDIASLRSVTLGSNSGVESIGWSFISSEASESVDLVIKLAAGSAAKMEYNRLWSDSNKDHTQYFKTINGVGFRLASFSGILYDNTALPHGDSWDISDKGDPAEAEFEDLRQVLNKLDGRFVTLTFSQVNSLPRRALSGTSNIKCVNLPRATRLYHEALSNCKTLREISAPLVTTISDSVFSGSVNLSSVSLPSAMVIGASLFQYSSVMTNLVLGSEANIISCDVQCFETMGNMDNITLTTCTQAEITDVNVTISGNKFNIVNHDKYDEDGVTTYTFLKIIQK